MLKYDTLTIFCLLTLVPTLRAHLTVTCNILTVRGLEELFSSCAVVSVFWFWQEIIVFGVTFVLRVQYSCGIVLVVLVLVGNSFWCYIRT